MKNMQTINRSKQKGQIILLIVLLTVAGATIALSLVSRTITDVRISTQIEESNRAISAAEAGIESALKAGMGTIDQGNISLTDAQAEFKVEAIGGGTDAFSFPLTQIGESQTLWLMEHNEDGALNFASYFPHDGNLRVCFGRLGFSEVPALAVSLFYSDLADNVKISKNGYDIEVEGNIRGNFINKVTIASSGHCSEGYTHKVDLSMAGDFQLGLGDKPVALRLQPVYADTLMEVKPLDGALLPQQGIEIVSTGKTESGTLRKVVVKRGYYTLPEIFNYTYFDEGRN